MFIETASTLVKTVLITADATGGVLAYSLALASELAKSGTKVHLAMMGPKLRSEQAVLAHSVPGLVLHESTYALEWMDAPWPDVARATEWLRDLERQTRPDIIHLNGYCHAAAGFVAPAVITAHSCLLSRWEAVEGTSPPERYSAYREAVRRGLRSASAVIAVSQSMRADLERHYGPLQRAAVVHPGIAGRDATGDSSPEQEEKEEVILAAGRVWDRAKNVEMLARVAGELPWPLKVAGDLTLPGVAHGSGEALGARPGLEPLGWVPPSALSALMARASIFVLPARYEPFGLSALEAALHGCALVLGDIPSLREVWGDGALYVGTDDDKGIVAALSKLAADSRLRRELSEAARLRARLYTPARTARAMREVYDTILGARRITVPIYQVFESPTM